MRIFLLKVYVQVRWWYFHAHPSYIKFYMDSDRTEAHFQNVKTGQLHSNYEVVTKEPKP